MPQENEEEPAFNISPAKADRWLLRIKNVLFDDYKDFKDGSYQGDIKEEIIKLIQKNFPLNTPIAEDEFEVAIAVCVRDVVRYIKEHTNGVHENFILNFAADFVSQTLTTIFKVSESDPPPGIRNDDFMYG